MRIIVLVLFLTLSLFAVELDQVQVNADKYVIQLSTVKSRTSALKVIRKYPYDEMYIAQVKKYIVVYAVNYDTVEDAKEVLPEFRKKYKDAYIRKLTKLAHGTKVKIKTKKVVQEFITSDSKPQKNVNYQRESLVKIEEEILKEDRPIIKEKPVIENIVVVNESANEIIKPEEVELKETESKEVEVIDEVKIVKLVEVEEVAEVAQVKNIEVIVDESKIIKNTQKPKKNINYKREELTKQEEIPENEIEVIDEVVEIIVDEPNIENISKELQVVNEIKEKNISKEVPLEASVTEEIEIEEVIIDEPKAEKVGIAEVIIDEPKKEEISKELPVIQEQEKREKSLFPLVLLDENNTKENLLTVLPDLLIKKDENKTVEKVSIDDQEIFQANRKQGYSLVEAVIHSLNKNYKLKASNQRVVQSKQRVKEREAGHLPVIDISGNSGYEARTSEGGDISDTAVADQKFNYKKTELYLSITENLWSGGKIEGDINEQENKVKSSLYDHRDKIETATLEIINAYFDVVYGEISVKISKLNMLNYQKILKIVKIKEENGASTKGDVNFILANVKNAKTSFVNTQAALSDAMAKYEYLMFDVDKSNMPYQTQVDIYTHDLDRAIDDMQKNNAKILKQKSLIKASNFALVSQNAAYQPTVDFALNAESKDEFDKGIGRRQKVSALVSFNYNLYRGGKDEAAYIRVLSKMNEQKYTLNDLERKSIFDIKVIHRSVASIEESLELTRSEVEAATKVVDSYWIAFKHGTQDLQALQLAQRNLNRSQLDYVKYKKGLILNDFKLMKSTGELLKFLKLDTSSL